MISLGIFHWIFLEIFHGISLGIFHWIFPWDIPREHVVFAFGTFYNT